MRKIIFGGTIVNQGRQFKGSVVIDNDIIGEIIEGTDYPRDITSEMIDATGCFVLPGVIDDHVHFREPGLTHKATIESETKAAAYGGVTSVLEMPNTNPQTTTPQTLEEKWHIAEQTAHINCGFFLGATNKNASLFGQTDPEHIPGIKLFMGASTGNMLVDRREALDEIFHETAKLRLPLMVHCEDTHLINANMKRIKEQTHSDDPDIRYHDRIRSAEACFTSSHLAVELAHRHGTQLHIAHISTKEEIDLLPLCHESEIPQITGEVVPAHLLFEAHDYSTLGARIKCNPSVKSSEHRRVLLESLKNNRFFVIGTDHAPHLINEKQGGAAKAVSGMPMIQFSLVSMLQLVTEGWIDIEQLVALMCHHPAQLFGISHRGYLIPGYYADITIVQKVKPWTITHDMVQSKCRWTPLEGREVQWKVIHTFCNGAHILDKDSFDNQPKGRLLTFKR